MNVNAFPFPATCNYSLDKAILFRASCESLAHPGKFNGENRSANVSLQLRILANICAPRVNYLRVNREHEYSSFAISTNLETPWQNVNRVIISKVRDCFTTVASGFTSLSRLCAWWHINEGVNEEKQSIIRFPDSRY